MQYTLSLQASAFNSPTGCQPASQGHKDGNLTCYVRFDLLQPGFVFSDGEPTSVREFLVAPVPMVDNRRLPDLLGLQAQTCISVVTKEQNMATTIDVASKAVATACAHVSNLVTIVSFNPLSTLTSQDRCKRYGDLFGVTYRTVSTIRPRSAANGLNRRYATWFDSELA